jgi:hypothetical protein
MIGAHARGGKLLSGSGANEGVILHCEQRSQLFHRHLSIILLNKILSFKGLAEF